ncbi:unnamed protein product [Symbiodinium sp. CCMP2456]|nr:unnamed protein product [Symbiodinium sp. CCMP2456]
MGRGGRGGKTWSSQGSDSGGAGARNWQVWHGASPTVAPWRTRPEPKASFPAYNSRPAPTDVEEGPERPGPREDGGLSSFQALLNIARKAENKVSKTQAAIERGKRQYASFQKDLRTTYLKEKERFAKDQERMQRELEEALHIQQQARMDVQRAVLPNTAPAAIQPDPAEKEWDRLTREWEQELEYGNEEVLRRALTARAAEAFRTPVRTPVIPDRSPLPRSAATARGLIEPMETEVGPISPLCAADPYLVPQGPVAPSPGALAGSLEEMTLGMTPGDVKQDSRPTGPAAELVAGKTLGEKLEERRAAERTQGRRIEIQEDDSDDELDASGGTEAAAALVKEAMS